MKMSPALILSRPWFMLQVLFLTSILHEPRECSAAFVPYHTGSSTTIHKSLKTIQNKQQTSKKGQRHPLYVSSSASDTNNDAAKVPFFANSLGGGVGSFFSSNPSSQKPTSSEGKAASITTRIPLGTLFDSRDYTFETLTNVRLVHIFQFVFIVMVIIIINSFYLLNV